MVDSTGLVCLETFLANDVELLLKRSHDTIASENAVNLGKEFVPELKLALLKYPDSLLDGEIFPEELSKGLDVLHAGSSGCNYES